MRKRTNSFLACGAMIAGLLFLVPCASIAQELPLYTQWVNYDEANGFPEGEVFSVKVEGNRVWAGTEKGLVLIENGQVKKIFTMADGLVGRAVMSIAVDEQTGDLWIGTFGGLSHYSGGQFKNYTNLSSGLANDLVYSVLPQGQYIWAATAAGVSRLDTHSGAWRIFNEKNSPFDEPWSYSLSLGKDKIYMGIWGGGVIVYDIKNESWRPYTDPDGEMEIILYRNQGLIHQIVSSVSYNPDSDMFWASTYFGLSGYDGRNWHNYLNKDSGLASDFINVVKSRGDEVWACTDKGLSFLDYKTQTWANYFPGTEKGRGVIEITGADGKKHRIDTPTSLAHNYILNIDFQGTDIWVATARGLSHGIRQPRKGEQLNARNKNGR